jgi:hypothetical protein
MREMDMSDEMTTDRGEWNKKMLRQPQVNSARAERRRIDLLCLMENLMWSNASS